MHGHVVQQPSTIQVLQNKCTFQCFWIFPRYLYMYIYNSYIDLNSISYLRP